MWKRCKALALCLALGLLVADSPARGQDGKVVKAIQAKCATAKDANSPLRRLRVDGVTDKAGTAMVSGLLLRGGFGTYEAEEQALKDGLEGILKDILPGKLLDVSGVKKYAPEDLPHLKLQEKAAAAGRDEVLLSPVRFDEAGTAVLSARVGAGDDKAWLQDLAGKSFPQLRFKIETTALKRRFVPGLLQQKLTEAGGNRLLVERIRHEWSTTRQEAGDLLDLKVVVSGLHLEGAITRPRFVQFVEQLWPELFEEPTERLGIRCAVEHSNILSDLLEVQEDKLVKALQVAVSANTGLDGVRIERGLLFDADGKMILKGVVPSTSEKLMAELARSLQKAAADAGTIPDRAPGLTYDRVIRRGVSSTWMSVVRSDLLLTDLRGWAAENVDDALLGRMHFNPDGKLTLHISTPSKDVDDKVLKEFQSRAAAKPYFPGIDSKELLANKKPFSDSFTGFLRSIVEHDQKSWDGVFIERGFFRFDLDPRGVYTVSGVADREGQPAALLRVFQENQTDRKWSEFLGVKPYRLQIDVLPLATMLDRLKRICPGYAAFDYIEFTGVSQHPRDGLVFSGDLFSRDAKQDLAENTAAQFLKVHPQWKRRARDGVKLKLAPCGNLGDESRSLRPYLAAKALARSDWPSACAELASLRRHTPESVEIWYLSAIYHHAVGDDELVRRDLTRVITMEAEMAPGGGLVTNENRLVRLNLAERIQGARRIQVDQMERNLQRKISDGASQIKLLSDPG